jgi:hypothetical protein
MIKNISIGMVLGVGIFIIVVCFLISNIVQSYNPVSMRDSNREWVITDSNINVPWAVSVSVEPTK